MEDITNIWAGDDVDANQGVDIEVSIDDISYTKYETAGVIGTSIGTLPWWEVTPAITCEVDQFSNDTYLHMHFNNLAAPLTFIDETGNHTPILPPNSGVRQTGAAARFPGGSAHFTGVGGIQATAANEANLSDDEYTIEAWVFPTDTHDLYGPIFAWYDGSLASETFLALNSGGIVQMSDTELYTAGSQSVIPLYEWTHIAVCYSNNTLDIYVNGVKESSTPWRTVWRDVSKPLSIGYLDILGTKRGFKGFIDEARLTNKRRYTSDFTPSVLPFCPDGTSTSPTPATTYKQKIRELSPSLYWGMDELSGSSMLEDNSSVEGTLSNVSINQSPMIAEGRSYDFNGVDSYIDVPSSEAMSAREQTHILWIVPPSSIPASPKGLYVKGSSTGLGVREFSIALNTGGTISVAGTTPSVFSGFNGDVVVTDGVRKMIAVTRAADPAGDIVSIYVDGVLDKTQQLTININQANEPLTLGRLTLTSAPDRYFDGKMDEVCVIDRVLDASTIADLYAARDVV